MNGLALAIVRHRKVKKQSQTDAADELGFTQTKLSRLELGHSKPYRDIPVIASWLGISDSRALNLLEAPAGTAQDIMQIMEEVRDIRESMATREEQVTAQIVDMRETLHELFRMSSPPATDLIARAIREKRSSHGMTVHELAMVMNISTSQVHRLEEGLVAMWPYTHELSAFLEVPHQELVRCLDAETDQYKEALATRMEANLDARSDHLKVARGALEVFHEMIEHTKAGVKDAKER
jgi:transcriptional regulator with XRE-family HTH domain